MLRDSRPATIILQAAFLLLYVVRDCFHAVYRPPLRSKDIETSTGIAGQGRHHVSGFTRRLFGWPPPLLDPARETAWLDGLRGVAAALVMTYHYHLSWHGVTTEAPYGAYEEQKLHFWRLPIFRLFYCSGHAQVCVFFVLSGFVLSWSAMGSIRTGRAEKVMTTLGSAMFRRWWRLYLPCILVGFLGMILFRFKVIGIAANPRDTIFGQIADWFVESLRWANPFHLERSPVQTLYSYNWTMWTIPDEFAGSLLTFSICLGICRLRNYYKRALVVFIIASWACVQAYWVYWLFATGVLLADYVRHAGGFQKLSQDTSRLGRFGWGILFFVGLLLAGIPENNERFPKPGYNWIYGLEPSNWSAIEGGVRFWWSWGAIFILAGGCHLSSVRRFFELSFVRYLGRLSFMLYVTHRTVEESFTHKLRQAVLRRVGYQVYNEWFKTMVWVANPYWELLLWFTAWVITGPTALIVANWCEILIDAPATRFARWLDDRFTNGFFPDPSSSSSSLSSSSQSLSLSASSSLPLNFESDRDRGRTRGGGEEGIGLLPVHRED